MRERAVYLVVWMCVIGVAIVGTVLFWSGHDRSVTVATVSEVKTPVMPPAEPEATVVVPLDERQCSDEARLLLKALRDPAQWVAKWDYKNLVHKDHTIVVWSGRDFADFFVNSNAVDLAPSMSANDSRLIHAEARALANRIRQEEESRKQERAREELRKLKGGKP